MGAIINKQNLREVLMHYIPENQQPYTKSKAFIALSDALWDYLTSDIDTKDEKLQILQHAREIFNHLTETTEPPGSYGDPERQTTRPWYAR